MTVAQDAIPRRRAVDPGRRRLRRRRPPNRPAAAPPTARRRPTMAAWRARSSNGCSRRGRRPRPRRVTRSAWRPVRMVGLPRDGHGRPRRPRRRPGQRRRGSDAAGAPRERGRRRGRRDARAGPRSACWTRPRPRPPRRPSWTGRAVHARDGTTPRVARPMPRRGQRPSPRMPPLRPDRAPTCAGSPTSAASSRPGPAPRPTAAADALRAAQRAYDDHESRADAGRAAADPRAVRDRQGRGPGALPPRPHRRDRPDEVEAAARAWLLEINRINARGARCRGRGHPRARGGAATIAEPRAARARGRRRPDRGRDGRGGLPRRPRGRRRLRGAPRPSGAPPSRRAGASSDADRPTSDEPLGSRSAAAARRASSGCCAATARR